MVNQKGIALALAAALLSGFSVFINGYAVTLADPFVYTLLKNAATILPLAAAVLAFRETDLLRHLSRNQWVMLSAIGIIGGSIPFLMFFWGLKLGGAAVSSFIFRSLFIFAGISGYFILREKPDPHDIAAAFLLLAGNALLIQGEFQFGFAQMLVLGATMLWALEYTLSRKLMADIHPRIVMLSRMFFGSIILFAFLSLNGSLSAISLSTELLVWLGIVSVLLFAFISSWYYALKHLPVLKATSLLAFGGVVTASLDILFRGRLLAPVEGIGLLLLLSGVLLALSSVDSIRNLGKTSRHMPDLIK